MMKRLVTSAGGQILRASSVSQAAITTKRQVSYVVQNELITSPQPVANGKFLAANVRSMPNESSVNEFMSHADDGQYFFMSTQPTQLPKNLVGKASFSSSEHSSIHPGHVMSAVLEVNAGKVSTVGGTVTNFLPEKSMPKSVAQDSETFIEHADKEMAVSKSKMDKRDLAGVMVAVKVAPTFVEQHKTTVAQLSSEKKYNLMGSACSNALIENVTGKPSTTPIATQTASVQVIDALTQSYDPHEKKEVDQVVQTVGLNIKGVDTKPFPRISDDKAADMMAAKKNPSGSKQNPVASRPYTL